MENVIFKKKTVSKIFEFYPRYQRNTQCYKREIKNISQKEQRDTNKRV